MNTLHPYLQSAIGGVLIGLASWLVLASLGRVTGISGIVSSALLGPKGDAAWRRAFLVGLIGGGAIFSLLLGIPQPEPQPLWLMVLAGLLVGYGTVRGSGCTSGHGVCGLGRRSKRSLVAVLLFMGSAMATVFVSQWLPLGR